MLVGAILLGILALNLFQHLTEKPPAKDATAKGADGKPKAAKGSAKTGPTKQPADIVPAYAHSIWFAWLVGLTGGFATILVNSMGPMLNVYLLTLQYVASQCCVTV